MNIKHKHFSSLFLLSFFFVTLFDLGGANAQGSAVRAIARYGDDSFRIFGDDIIKILIAMKLIFTNNLILIVVFGIILVAIGGYFSPRS